MVVSYRLHPAAIHRLIHAVVGFGSADDASFTVEVDAQTLEGLRAVCTYAESMLTDDEVRAAVHQHMQTLDQRLASATMTVSIMSLPVNLVLEPALVAFLLYWSSNLTLTLEQPLEPPLRELLERIGLLVPRVQLSIQRAAAEILLVALILGTPLLVSRYGRPPG